MGYYIARTIDGPQLGHVLAIRSERTSLFKQGLTSNLPLLGSVLLTIALQLSIIYMPPLSSLFKTVPLTATELLVCIGAAGLNEG